MSILRFQGDYTNKGTTFNNGQEWEVLDSYIGMLDDPCDDCPPKQTRFYRFVYPKDGITYTVPEDIVVIIEQNTTNNRTVTTQKEKWDRKVTRDQIKVIYDKEDYVRAAKEFMGIDIAAKKRQEQTDYAYYYPLSAALEQRTDGNLLGQDGEEVA